MDAGFDTAVYRPCIRGIDAGGCDKALEGIAKQGGMVVEDEETLKSWIE
jgi:hypothetical protein